jgi:hypothetical protein
MPKLSAKKLTKAVQKLCAHWVIDAELADLLYKTIREQRTTCATAKYGTGKRPWGSMVSPGAPGALIRKRRNT